MNNVGLAYEQAPPFGLPLRFFLTAPVFLFLAALAGLYGASDWLTSRWTPAALGLTHLLTLGYLGMVMVGALLQMIPVILGAPVPAVRLVATSAWLALGLGTPLLSLGLWSGEPILLMAAMATLGLGLVPFLLAAAVALARARSLPWVAWPIRQAGLALLATLGLGLTLASNLSGFWPLTDPAGLTGLHAAWGLGGWILILVTGIAYQVVPMLQLTPAYPAWLQRGLTWAMLAGLLVHSLLPASPWTLLPGVAAALTFAVVTLRLQRQRRRKLADVTLDFWRFGMASLILAAALLPFAGFLHEAAQTSLGLLFLLGFAASVVSGMLYKIVPFLAWFHLQAQTQARAGTIPNMKEMLPEAEARKHLRLHITAVALLLPAPFLAMFLPAPWLALPGLACLAASAILLGRNLLGARRLFAAHGGRL